MKTQFITFIFSIAILLVVDSQSYVNAQQNDFTCEAITEIPQIECETLVTFYQDTDGSNWRRSNDWLITNTPCNWYGVTCHSGHVKKLELFQNNLSGYIPSQLDLLNQLEYLDSTTAKLGYKNFMVS